MNKRPFLFNLFAKAFSIYTLVCVCVYYILGKYFWIFFLEHGLTGNQESIITCKLLSHCWTSCSPGKENLDLARTRQDVLFLYLTSIRNVLSYMLKPLSFWKRGYCLIVA